MLTDKQFRALLAARVKRFRERTGLTQEEMAHLLGLESKEPYAKYERRSALPHKLMYRFCLITKTSLDDLMTHKLDAEDMQVLAALEQQEKLERKAG